VVGIGYAGEGERTYTLQGDSKEAPDPEPVRPEQVRGEVWSSLPWVGHLGVMFTPRQHQLLVYVAAGGFFVCAAALLRQQRRDRRRGRLEEQEEGNAGAGDVNDIATWTPFSMANVAPGESRAAVLTPKNTAPTSFGVTATATATATGADLAPVVVVRVVVGDTTTPSRLPAHRDLHRGHAALRRGAGRHLRDRRPDGGRRRPGGNGGTTTVCAQATLPGTAGNQNGLQQKTWAPTFVFTATQS